MIKWGEFRDGETLLEAFLPEHQRELCEWLVRASRNGHVLGERRCSLVWPPKFGPDAGDVAAAEALSDLLLADVGTAEVPHGAGSYCPREIEVSPSEPILCAMLYALVEQYVQAEASLGLSDERSAAYLGIPVPAGARGLYPFAVTRERDARMNRLIALDQALKTRVELQAHKGELLRSMLDGDIPRLRRLLAEAGVDDMPD